MSPLARSIIIDFMLSLVFISLLRLSKRIIIKSGKNTKYKNTLIIGANSSINSLLYDKKNLEHTPVAIIDGNELLIGTYILNLKVYAFEDLEKVIKTKSKLKAELELSKLENKNLKISILRTPIIYGYGVKAI